MASKLFEGGIFSLTLGTQPQHGKAFTRPFSCLFLEHTLEDLGLALSSLTRLIRSGPHAESRAIQTPLALQPTKGH